MQKAVSLISELSVIMESEETLKERLSEQRLMVEREEQRLQETESRYYS